MADFQNIANRFTDYYYQTLDSSPSNLATLYRPESQLTFEGQATLGSQNIIGKLSSINAKHLIKQKDTQPSLGNGNVDILVTGALAYDGAEDKPISFAETFTLYPIPGQTGGFFVGNQLFRMV